MGVVIQQQFESHFDTDTWQLLGNIYFCNVMTTFSRSTFDTMVGKKTFVITANGIS